MALNRKQIDQQLAMSLLKNNAEFTSYSLIANDAVNGAKLVMGIDFESQIYSQDDIALIKEAFKIHRIINDLDFNQFFKLISAKRTNYMFACLMLTRLDFMRRIAIERLSRAYSNKCPALSQVQKLCLLNIEADAQTMIHALGFRYNDGQQKSREEDDIWKESYRKWRQTGPLVSIEALRNGVIRATVMKDGVLAFKSAINPAEAAKKIEQERLR